MPQYHTLSKLVVAILLYNIVVGCTSLGPTKPNESYLGPYPSGFTELAHNNPLIAEELGKIPELQDGISREEAAALETIVELYKNNPNSFNAAFNLMYRIGKPEVRKYCSPLQALYWMAEDGMYEKMAAIIEVYDLTFLLYWTWYRTDKWDVPGNEKKYHLRWKDYKVVADRLNAPELVSYYLNYFITYRTFQPKHPSSYFTFMAKEGHCIDAAIFAVDMLKRAGYQTFMRHVVWGPNIWTDNHCGSGIILKDGQYLIVADFTPGGNRLSGPYKRIEGVDIILSGGRTVIEQRWGHLK